MPASCNQNDSQRNSPVIQWSANRRRRHSNRRCSAGAAAGRTGDLGRRQVAEFVAAGVLCLASGLALAASKDWSLTALAPRIGKRLAGQRTGRPKL
jgi:hypothetical protein